MAANRVRLVLFVTAALVPLVMVAGPEAAAPPTASDTARPGLASHPRPIAFEANRGQTDAKVSFLARAPGYRLFLTPAEAVLALDGATLRLSAVDANPAPTVRGVDQATATVSYLTGNTRLQSVPTYDRVRVADLYPGIDVEYHGGAGQLEYDYLVSPGADPSRIGLEVAGATSIAVDDNGDLVLATTAGTVVQHRPVAYQEIAGQRRPVQVGYLLEASNRIRLQLGAYDRRLPLVIDPVIAYSTYLGGSTPGLGDDEGDAIAVDDPGNAYVTGRTTTSDFPKSVPLDLTLGGTDDAFVTKYSPNGALLWSTYFGGNGLDQGLGIAVNPAGDALYLTGLTTSDNTTFPLTGAADSTLGGTQDAFVAKLATAAGTVTWSTYFGGDGDEAGNAISTDTTGKPWLTGFTTSGATTFPDLAAFDATLGGTQDAFVAKLDTSGVLVTATYLGGEGDESGQGISNGPSDFPYVTGFTTTPETATDPFPLLGAIDGTLGGSQDAFLTRFDPTGSVILSAYFGGNGDDSGYAVAAGNGHAVVTGSTTSTDLTAPAPGPDTTLGGTQDAFVASIENTSNPDWITYLGGDGDEAGYGVALQPNEDVWVTGFTTSAPGAGGFPLVTPVDASFAGSEEAFATRIDDDTVATDFSTYLGGDSDEEGFGIAVSGQDAHVTGFTTSAANFPIVNANDSALGGASDGFVTKLAQDVVPPTCFVTAFVPGPPRVWSITVQDPGSGLASVTATTATNGTLGVPAFTAGTTAPVVATFTKITQTAPSALTVDVTDVDGNVTTCTPLRQSMPGVVTSSVNWKLRDVLPGSGPPTHLFTFGSTPLVPIIGDWDGDGVKTPGFFKGGVFTLSNNFNGTGTPVTFPFGDARGFPVAGDWDGNGKDEVAVFRNGGWTVRANALTGTQPSSTFSFGTGVWPATVPLAGDWDANGTDGIGFYMGNGVGVGTWMLRQTATNTPADIGPFAYEPTSPGYPVVGDWDADGDVTIGTKNGLVWQLRNANSAGAPDLTISLGSATPASDLPMVWSAT